MAQVKLTVGTPTGDLQKSFVESGGSNRNSYTNSQGGSNRNSYTNSQENLSRSGEVGLHWSNIVGLHSRVTMVGYSVVTCWG